MRVFSLDLAWPAIGAASLAHVVVGFVWYQPRVFGARWAALTGRSMSGAGSGPLIGATIVLAVLAAVVLAMFIRAAGAATPVEGLKVGLLGWSGFTATATLVDSLFAGRRTSLWLIQAGYQFVGFAAMGLILGAWS